MASFPGVCSVSDANKLRFEKIRETFLEKYGTQPTFFARAPGRVNLIGEHIDYCGYSVLPMAIEQDMVLAVAVNSDSKINLKNTDHNFQDYTCSISDIKINKSSPSWYDYFLCGFRGISEYCSLSPSVGLDLLLDGTVPKSAGLSSSSALVCCSALAVMHANNKLISKLELAELCQHCERYIGTEGGGMDQSISFLAQPGTVSRFRLFGRYEAKLIEFNPIRAHDVSLPEGAVFVVSNSCVEMNKAATAHFNIRVTECRLAAQILAKGKGLNWKTFRKLGDLHKELAVTLEDMVDLVKKTLHQEPYTKTEVCNILEVTPEELSQTSLNEKTLDVESFKLCDRAVHVYSEANRVLQFKKICDSGHPGALQELGSLMNDSHTSCRDQYECSCTELDVLTDIARASGALGSRLTGAGWGGCAVSLLPGDKVTAFLKQVTDKFYLADPVRAAKVKESLFATQPGGGACIYTCDS